MAVPVRDALDLTRCGGVILVAWVVLAGIGVGDHG